MKEIALIGCFSSADANQKNKEDKPNLYKQIKEIITGNQYELSYLFLLVEWRYKIDEQVNDYKKIIDEDTELNENQKSRFKNILETVEFTENISAIEKNHVYYMVSSNSTGFDIQWFYDQYFAFVENLSCNNVCLNLVSGNVQSKTALHMIPMSFPNKHFNSYYNQMEKGEHRTDPDALAYMEGNCSELLDESEFPGYGSRIVFPNMNYIRNKIYVHTFNSYIKSKDYSAAYFYLIGKKPLFEKLDKEKTDLYIKCFEEKRKLLFHVGDNDCFYVTQEEVADYFLQRLTYLKSIPDDKKLTYSSMSVLQDLIYTLFHIEENDRTNEIPDYRIKKEGNHYILKDEEFIYSVGCYYYKNRKINNGRLESNPFSISEIDSFIRAFNSNRHANEQDNEYNSFTSNQFDIIIESLIKKYDSGYCSYSSSHKKFADFYKDISNLQYSIPNKDEKENEKGFDFKNVKPNSKCCVLSMMGSTDPGTIWTKDGQEYYFMYGSNLAFYKEIQRDGNPLKTCLEQNKIPHYLMVTKEIAETFKNNNAALNQLKNIYGNQNIHLIPFGCDSEANDFIEAWSRLDNKESDYSIENCFRAMEKFMSTKINEFDDVFVIVSSGIPHVKISSYFLSVFHPNKIHVVEVAGPNDSYKGLKKNKDSRNNTNNAGRQRTYGKEIKSIDYPNVLVQQNLVPIKLELLYKQKISFDTFDSPEIEQIEGYGKVKKIFDENIDMDSENPNRDKKVISNLIRLHYVQTETQGFDYCLETIFYEYQEKLRKRSDLKRFFESWDIRDLPIDVKKCIRQYNQSAEDSIPEQLDTKRPKTGRLYGIVRGILYKNYYDRTIKLKDLHDIDCLWDVVSRNKHKSESDNKYNNDQSIELILKFNQKLEEKYKIDVEILDHFKRKILLQYSLYC